MSSISTATSASQIQTDYMKLLITQLQNQNPLEPLDNNDMATQLAQFSQLQQLESMNSNFADVLTTAKRSYANSLIGKDVSFFTETETSDLKEMNGTVKEVFNDPNGENLLVIETDEGEYTLSLNGIISVRS